MNKEQLAELLNGRESGDEITKEEEKLAKDNGLVVVFGYSDDNAELRGAISDEVGCYDGGDIYLHQGGLLAPHEDDCECKYCTFQETLNKCAKIEAVFGDTDYSDYSWTYRTKIPHATFEITEEGAPYCRGIVFNIGDLPTL